MRERLSLEQLQGWRAFYEMERFGDHHHHKAIGILGAVVLNAFIKRKSGGSFTPEEIIPWLEQREIVDGLITLDPDDQVRAFDRTFTRRSN